MLAILLIILGIVLWLLVSPLAGILCIIFGVLLFFVPGAPYGYSHYRRGPP
jgi:hypothetical protein